MFCIFAQWTTPWRYDPRREDQGKQCWSFVSFVLMLFTPYTCTHTQKVKLLIKEFVMKWWSVFWVCGFVSNCSLSTDTMYIMYIMTCRNSGSGRRWLRICDRQHPCPRRDSGHGFSHNDFGVLLQCCDMFPSCPYTIPICDGWFFITIKVVFFHNWWFKILRLR